MFSNLILKFSLFFVAGAAVMYGALSIVPDSTQKRVLGKNTTVDEYVHEVAWEQVNSWSQSILESVLPGLVKNPAFKPVMKTKSDIEMTTEEVRNLPKSQKSAICKEVCGSSTE